VSFVVFPELPIDATTTAPLEIAYETAVCGLTGQPPG
jgi:hypothetical protein